MFTWDELERKYNMKLKQPPLRLSGGLMHKMYKLETDQGIYALKLLNPFIMQRSLTQGPITRNMLLFALPLALSSIHIAFGKSLLGFFICCT